MATKYKKSLKTIKVKTLGGTTVTVADTKDKPYASNALMEFEDFKTITVDDGSKKTVIPFHAVDNIEVTAALSDEITRPDPYGCDEEEVAGGKTEVDDDF